MCWQVHRTTGTFDVFGRNINEYNPPRQALGRVLAIYYHVTDHHKHNDFKQHMLITKQSLSTRNPAQLGTEAVVQDGPPQCCPGCGMLWGNWVAVILPEFAHSLTWLLKGLHSPMTYLLWGSFYGTVLSILEGFLRQRQCTKQKLSSSHSYPRGGALYFFYLVFKGETVTRSHHRSLSSGSIPRADTGMGRPVSPAFCPTACTSAHHIIHGAIRHHS